MTFKSECMRALVIAFAALTAATATWSETINVDIIPNKIPAGNDNGWNRVYIGNSDWTPIGLVNSNGDVTSVALQVYQRTTSIDSNAFINANALTGDAAAIFETTAATAAPYNAPMWGARSGTGGYFTLNLLGLSSNETYRLTIFSSRISGVDQEETMILNQAQPNEVVSDPFNPRNNFSEIIVLETTSYYKAGHPINFTGGKINTDMISFKVQAAAGKVAYLNAFTIETVPPPPPPPPSGTLIRVQ